VAATTVTAKKKTTTCDSDTNNKNSNEPVLYERERSKINSLARVLQLENALYNDETVMRFAAISMARPVEENNIVHISIIRLSYKAAYVFQVVIF
jgi:hypothetical protein